MSWFSKKNAEVIPLIKPKILFLCRQRHEFSYSYNATGLKTSALLVTHMLNKHNFDAKLVEVVDSNSIDREVSLFKPEVVVIEAFWVPPYKFAELKKLHPKVKFVVRCHSKPDFLATEGSAYEWIQSYKKMGISIATNHEGSVQEFNYITYSEDTLLLPNYYLLTPNHYIKKNDHELNIGCFGALRILKNQMNQAIAAIEIAKEDRRYLKFHINSERKEGPGSENILKSLRALFAEYSEFATLVEHPWLKHEDFLKLLEGMDISMQVSLSETFNIVSADTVQANVPILTSKEIYWSPNQSATSVADIMFNLYDLVNLSENQRKEMVVKQRKYLEKYNEFSIKMWKKELGKLNLSI